jgi:mono/diheme cytochrome c family protein
MRAWLLVVAVALGLGATVMSSRLAPGGETADPVAHGRYLVVIGGCNDCHTPGYRESAGKVPETRWLIGDSLGFSGPWGTTYPVNLRSFLAAMDEDGWVKYAREHEARPPMPWFNLRDMTETDLRAIHRYVRSLPADDNQVPGYLPPGVTPATPHFVLVPQASKP